MALIQSETDKAPALGLYGNYKDVSVWIGGRHRHRLYHGTAVMFGDHGTWVNKTDRCSGISVLGKDGVWHAFALKGGCIKEGVSVNDSEEILQRDGLVYQVSGVTRDPVTGQAWRTVSRCVDGH